MRDKHIDDAIEITFCCIQYGVSRLWHVQAFDGSRVSDRVVDLADVEFTWKWIPLNEVGSALNVGGLLYKSTVSLKHYDDGWRLLDGSTTKTNQSLEDALKNADPVP